MKVIIFDLGGVVIPERIGTIRKEIAKELGLENLDSVASNELKTKVTKGQIRLLDFYAEIIKKMNKDISPEFLLNKHLEIFRKESTKIDPEMISLINNLKKNYIVACLTNTEIEIAEINRETGLFNHFDKAYISTEMDSLKPEAEIYHKVINDLGYLPEELMFIDNKMEYVDGARDVGINGIIFQNTKQLKKDLIEMGIKF